VYKVPIVAAGSGEVVVIVNPPPLPGAATVSENVCWTLTWGELESRT
jgi:hypothetical protein